jgi:outer membrane receptor protein involved in Fe transport
VGTPTATQRNETQLNTDVAAKWTSKFFDNKTQVDAVFGWHRFKRDYRSINEFFPNDPTLRTDDQIPTLLTNRTDRSANAWTLAGVGTNNDTPESQAVMDACRDSTDRSIDRFNRIRNCPIVTGYNMGPLTSNLDILEQRFTGKLTATQRVKALGHHQFKAGVDFEDQSLDNPREYNGTEGVGLVQNLNNIWRFRRFVQLDPNGTDFCTNNLLGGEDQACNYVRSPQAVEGETLNFGAFIQDSWSILPNLTINAGLRYEQQYLRYAKAVRDTIDPITMDEVGTNAMKLTDLFAPRVGLIYDWTKEGRSKVYANWGRFYEAIPMDINDRAFGGETTYFEYHAQAACGATTDAFPLWPSLPGGCPKSTSADDIIGGFMLGASDPGYGVPAGTTLVMPDVSAQYLDEIVVGVEYEVLEDLRLGVSYQNRRLGRVIEDVSTDGGNTYFIANPGEFSDGAEQDLIDQINSFNMDDPRREQLKTRLQAFQQTRRFDEPQRVYNAVQLTASKRFSRDFMVQGSYTYSNLEGNFPGLFSPDTGQLDPNITSMYDLFELLANRNGKLPFDRPHAFKLGGYYKFDLKEAGLVTAGARIRAQSGVPITPLGNHSAYGREEAFLLPRGTAGRTAFESAVDLHVAYGRKLGSMELEVFFELFNLLNNQGETGVDQEYTLTFTDPIVGGDEGDLNYLKASDGSSVHGDGTTSPAAKLLNYQNTNAKQAPLAARIGLSLSF